MTKLKENSKKIVGKAVQRYKEPDNKFLSKLADIFLIVSGSLEATGNGSWVAFGLSVGAKILTYFSK